MSTIERAGRHTSATQEATLPLVSVVIPCLNEAENIEECVTRARAVLEEHGLNGEVVVADNGSTDGSPELAAAAGARVIHEERRGYGSAYLAGFANARGEYIVMLDADLTYPFELIPRFVDELAGGAELVMGDRMDNIQPGAMPWLHQYVGNPILSGILNLFFRTGVRDAHCGMRGLRRDILPKLDLRTPGMEFASEMVIRASKEKLRIAEFPITYHPRGGESKLSSFRDGWRHLRFLLVHSPTHLFLWPGVVLATLGVLVMAAVLGGLDIVGRPLYLHSMIAGSLLLVVGTQIVSLGLCAHAYGMYFMGDRDPWFDRMRSRFRLEHGLAVGGLVIALGVTVCAVVFAIWADRGFGSLSEESLAVLGATLIIVGVQIFFSSFLLSILGLRRRSQSSDHDVPGGGPSVAEPLVAVDAARRSSAAEEARTLLAGTGQGALASLSEDGGPWSSYVAYGVLEDGSPVLCLSQLAEHGRNLRADPRASLLVVSPAEGPDPLAAGRVTLAGRVRPGDAVAREAYVSGVPSGHVYVDFGDFDLWVLTVERVRWVGGYGRMASASAEDYAAARADPVAPSAPGAVAHLNADHADALLDMARSLAGHPDATAATCTGADRYGLDLTVSTPRGIAPARVGFAGACSAPGDLRGATVELARRARG